MLLINDFMSKLILESLDSKRLEVLKELKAFSNIGVLGGGTALALQIGHRISYDFDIFTYELPSPYLWTKAKKVFGSSLHRTKDEEYQLDILTNSGVSITFFNDDYQQLFEPISTDYFDLMDIRDIASNKAFTIGRRPKWRDYVDIYFILKENHLSMSELIKISNKKFGNGFSEKLFIEQLTYWGDITDFEIKYLKNEIDPKIVQDFLLTESQKFLSNSLGSQVQKGQ